MRLKFTADWKKISVLFIAVIGAVGSVISVLTVSSQSLNLYFGIGIVSLTFLAVIIFAYIIPKKNLPDGVEEITQAFEVSPNSKTTRIVFPCDYRYFKAANKLAKEKFGKNSVSTRVVNDWKRKNNLILTCLLDRNKVVGYFDILPLKKDFAERLIDGEASEKDIKGEYILSKNEMKNAEYIYFAGIAVEETQSGKGLLHATYLICAALMYISIFYKDGKLRKVLTIPTSECGLKMAEHLDFQLLTDGKLRKDGYDLYSQDFKFSRILALIRKQNLVYRRFDSSAYNAKNVLGSVN